MGGTTVRAGKPQYTGIQIQTSSSTLPLTLAWGMNRLAPNLMWYGDFKAHKKKQKSGKGGVKTEYYEYSASLQMGLCEGQITGIGRVYLDQAEDTEVSFASTGYVLFNGSDPQSPWGYLVTKHPDKALNYAGVAYIAIPNYNLGQQASLPQHNFEVKALRYNSAEIATGDADSALVIDDFLTDPQFGAGFPAAGMDYDQLFSTVDAPTTGDGTFQTYCQAMGFAMSPTLASQETASTILDRWCKLMNTAIVWTGEKLKFIPYGDETQIGGGVQYNPATEVRYSLTDADYIGDSGADPIILNRTDPAEAYNSFKIKVRDRANQYNDTPVEWKDQNLIELYGLRPEGSMEASEITDPDMGSRIVALMGQRMAYIRNRFDCVLPNSFIRLEPMDICEAFDPSWGNMPVRVVEVTEQDDGSLAVVFEEFPEGVSSTSGFGTQANDGGGQNQLTPPGPVNPPIIFEPPVALSGGANQIWAAVSGGDGTDYGEFWGGCYVWLSIDDVTYQQVGIVDSPARMGIISTALPDYVGANPDTTNTIDANMAMSNGDLISVAPIDAQNMVTVCYVDGELISFETATLTGNARYDLDTLYRGLYGTEVNAHLVNTAFARLDENIFKYTLPTNYLGETVYIKLQSFNLWGLALEDLSLLTPYTYVPDGGGAPSEPTSLIATGGYQQNFIRWTPSPTGAILNYNVYAFHGTSSDFNDGTFLGESTVPNFTHAGLGDNDTWTYWATAVTIGGESGPSNGNTTTTSPAGGSTGAPVTEQVAPASTSTLSFGSRGALVIPTTNFDLAALIFQFIVDNTETYTASVVILDGSNNVLSIVDEVTLSGLTTTLDYVPITFTFPIQLSLIAGTRYGFILTRNVALGNTTWAMADTATFGFMPNTGMSTVTNYLRAAVNLLTVGQAYATGSNPFWFAARVNV